MAGNAAWRRPSVAVPAAAGLAALVAAGAVVRPLRSVLIGSDTASSVLYFQRILGGETLERFLGTTPKPLLTVVDGLLYTATGDWRPIAWLALVVYAMAIASAVALAVRVSGTVGGVFVAVGLIACAGLLQDVALAYAVSWALLAVCVAGLCLTVERPRYGLAGLALAGGALARQEVFVVIGIAVVAVAVTWWLDRDWQDRSRGRWLLLIALVAIPLTVAHDLLLAGDPLYTLRVSTLGAEGRDVRGMSAAVRALAAHGLGNLLLLVLAAVGVVALLRRGSTAWLVLLGAASVAIGVSLLVLFVGLRGLIVLDRYALPVELALIFLAGCGLATIRLSDLTTAVPRVVVLVLAAVVALGVSPRIGPLDRETTKRIQIEAQAGRDYADILPDLAAEVARLPGYRTPPATRDPTARGLSGPVLYVTPRLLSIVLVDLDLRLDHVARLNQFDPGAATATVDAGTLALHLARIETQVGAPWAEIDAPVTYPSLVVRPLKRIDERVWFLRIDPR